MSKVTLTDLASLVNENSAINTINNNNTAVEAGFDNTLSRDGTTPNQMDADIDMNSNDLLNVGRINATDFFVSGTDITETTKESQAAAAASASSAANSATQADASATSAANSAEEAKSFTQVELDSVAGAVSSYHPDAAPSKIRVAGYTIAGDGGSALYVKVNSQPTYPGYFSITLSDGSTSAYYQLTTNSPDVRMFGGGTGIPDTDGPALEDMIAYLTGSGVTSSDINIVQATYTMSKGTLLPSGNRYLFNNSILDYSGVATNTLIPTQNAPPPATQVKNTFLAGVGSISALPNLSADVVRNQYIIGFASAHGLSSQDIIEIYNPTDYSWSDERVYYRNGELARVMVVPDTTTVWLDQGLWDNYATADVTISKYTTWKGSIQDVHIIGNSDRTVATYGLVIEFGSDAYIKNVSAERVSYNSHVMSRVMDFHMEYIRGTDDQLNDFDGDYGLGVYSCQRGHINDCHFSAARHAITHGCIGGSVPFRDIHYERCSTRSVDTNGVNNVPSWDFHAIGEYCSIDHCQIGNCLNVGAKNVTVSNSRLFSLTGFAECIQTQSVVGGVLKLLNNEYWIDVANTLGGSSNGIIHFANSSSHAHLKEDITYDIQGVHIRGASQTGKNIVSIWTTNTTYKVNISIDGVDDPDINADRTALLYCNGNSASPIAATFINIKNVYRLTSGVPYASYLNTYPNPTKCDFPTQSSNVTLTPTTSESTVNGSTVTLAHGYPETPNVLTTTGTRQLGGKAWNAAAGSVGKTSFVPIGQAADSANFSSTTTGSLYWMTVLQRG